MNNLFLDNTLNNEDISRIDIRNDFMFSYVMRDPKICIELLEYLLPGRKIDKVQYYHVEGDIAKPETDPRKNLLLETQKSLNEAPLKRGVRLDAYLDDGLTIYNIELQNNFQDYLPQRARLYQGHLDINQLKRGNNFDKLRPSFVIFICTFDPFKKGLYRYFFRNVCAEDQSLELNDEAFKLFFSTVGTQGDISDSLREVLTYINNPETYPVQKTDLQLIRSIDNAVSEAKMDDEWRLAYMTYQIHQRDAELRGEKRGIAIGEKRGEQRGIAIGEKRGEKRGEQRGKIIGAIETYRELGLSDNQIKDSLIKRFNLSLAEASDFMVRPVQ